MKEKLTQVELFGLTETQIIMAKILLNEVGKDSAMVFIDKFNCKYRGTPYCMFPPGWCPCGKRGDA